LENLQMKKTLIAVAALAATSAFAQVTISGKLGFSIQKSDAVTTTSASQGMRMTDGDVTFAAAEDLGGGYKASASTAVKLRGRDNGVTGRDAVITLTTPMGVLAAGQVETGPLLSNAWAGAQASFSSGPDALIMDGYQAIDIVGFTMPLATGLNVSVAAFEVGTYDEGFLSQTAANKLAGTVTSVSGTAGNVTTVGGVQVALAYSQGALALNADYTGNTANKVVSELNDGLTRLRVAGTYDFGAAKVGLGVQTKSKGVASQYAFGVMVPVNNFEFGLTYSARNVQSAVTGDTSGAVIVAAADARSGTTLGLKYNLSKTANISAQYAAYSGVGSVNGSAATSDNEYRIRLLKSF
jgi:hypothetical protein